MSDPITLIDKAVNLIDLHLEQIRIQATLLTKEGPKGFSTYDSQVIERYTKLLLAMTKKTEEDDLSDKTDEELEAILNERQDNVSDPTSTT